MSQTAAGGESAAGVVRNAGLMSFGVATSRVSGLVREMVMARFFGAGYLMDAYGLAFRIPNLTRDLFAEGALSSAFVPVFTEVMTREGKERAVRLASLVGTALVMIVGVICLVGCVFSEEIVRWVVPGFSKVPGKAELAGQLTRIMFPFLLLVALAAQAMGILNACRNFAVPALSSTFFNIGSVVGGLLVGYGLGPMLGMQPITGMAWGVLIGGALQLGFQLPALHRLGFRFSLLMDWKDEGLQRILKLMGPALIGNAATLLNVLVTSDIAARIEDPVRGFDGPVSWLNYSFRFMQLPLGLFGVAIGSANMAAISRHAATGAMDEFRATLSRSLGLVFLLTVPSSVGLLVLGKAMIGVIYEGGEFNAYDTARTGAALSFYALGLAGYAALKVLNPGFYALKDSRTPMIASLLSVAVNFAAATLLVKHTSMGHAGLALSTSLIALSSFVLLFLVMRGRIGGVYGRALRTSVLKVIAAAAAMGLLVYFVSQWIQTTMSAGKLAYLAELGVCIPLGAAAYYAVCRWLQVDELEMATQALAGPLRKRMSRLKS
jgi:putative peptidoglycan lipid II flippase